MTDISDKEMSTLVRQRGSIKARLTNFISFLNGIPSDQQLSSDLSHEVEIRQSKLEPLLTELNNVQLQIEMGSEDPIEQYKERETFENRYYNAMARANVIVMKKLPSDAVGRECKPTIHKESAFQLRRLGDTFMKNLKSLELLEEPTQHWDTLLIHILCNKLDTETIHEWEKYKIMTPDTQIIKFEDLIKFMRTRADMLDTLEQRHVKGERSERPRALLTQNTDKKTCPLCKHESHALYNCKKFLDMSPKDRESKLKSLDICTNCLFKGHPTNKCKYGSCKHCNKKHNTLLHIHSNQGSTDQENTNVQGASSVLLCKSVPQGLLSTVVAQVHNTDHHRPVPVRAVLDSGSSVNLVTEHFCKKYNIPTSN
ncbi:putative bel15-i ag, partial [Operophtera brumata]